MRNAVWFNESPMLDSQDCGEVQAFLQVKGIGFDFVGRSADEAALHARINARYQPDMYLAWMDYGTPVEMKLTPARSVYTINIGLQGNWHSRVGAQSTDYGAGFIAIGSPGQEETVVSSANCRRVQACIDQDAVVRHMAMVLDRPVPQAPEFDRLLNTRAKSGSELLRTFSLVAHELENGAAADNPLVQRQLRDYLITRLLLIVPHRDRGDFSLSARSPSPASVRRAIEFIHAHAAEPIGITEIIAAAGVSGRSIFRHFRDWKGVSPLTYLREVRYRYAREDLEYNDPSTTVADVAQKWGFTNPGRFAREIQHRYGELPSTILRRDG